ncbi:MAG: glycosyltransferase family 2 protein, partial [Spirochaetota bacterium]|nr:glycosyltransferase family 2 protein [Spirochaetota bacterium]
MSDKDKNNPLVSVGIPTYNRPEGLRRTLECITGQTYKNLEIIVSDNCSSGNETQNIGKEFLEKDSRIKYFRQEENKGMEFNFKFVLEKASGEYFMWAADDDEWAYNFVEVCIKNIGNSSSIFTAFGVLNRKTKSYTICKLPDLSQYFSKYKNIMNFLSIMTSSLIYGIHKRNDIMFILDDVTFDWYDCYFIIKLILNKGFKVINSECLYKAGIDTTTRIMKSKNPSINRVFEYYPFFHSTLKLILKSRDLSIFEKISIIKKLFKFSISSYIYFE